MLMITLTMIAERAPSDRESVNIYTLDKLNYSSVNTSAFSYLSSFEVSLHLLISGMMFT